MGGPHTSQRSSQDVWRRREGSKGPGSAGSTAGITPEASHSVIRDRLQARRKAKRKARLRHAYDARAPSLAGRAGRQKAERAHENVTPKTDQNSEKQRNQMAEPRKLGVPGGVKV